MIKSLLKKNKRIKKKNQYQNVIPTLIFFYI
jgi:hypothetical protein